MKTVKIAQWGGRHLAYLPLYVAERLGFFKEAGIDVAIYPAGNDDAIFEEVATGRALFGVGDPVFVAIGREKGIKARVLAALVTHASMWGLTQHAEIKPFSQPSDFVGLRVGTFPRPSTAYTLLDALKKRHVRLLKSMQIIEAEIGQQAYLLASGQVDLILEIEPMVSMALQQGLHVVCNMGDFFPDVLFTGLMALDQTIEKDPALVRSMVTALQRGLDICHQDPSQAIAVGTSLFPALGAEIIEKAVRRTVAANGWPRQTLIQERSWRNLLKMRQDVGDLSEIPPFEEVIWRDSEKGRK